MSSARLVAALLPLLISACAPDAWRPDNPYDAFLNAIQTRCGDLQIGNRRIGDDLVNGPDAYFLDVTSRYYHREISAWNYANALSASFGGASDSAGIRCILDVQRTPDPLPPLGVGAY
ncbi:hypothetical protein [Accumulibacter sp.]|uniref:hypothetical protein n=1 Tax=Accumulibacter sp. TaxID=2053492 RepID=UPI0025DABB8A|nr:hypothetical protein [Accumulibacter sp.]MCM8595372.1 hypothetical protein [Accumulibacter sp.]MCM8627564.1 hypothetical protein [Accumulibacter sp.]MDS4049519.1 hypothetical protein [Accumulibacter sp.]